MQPSSYSVCRPHAPHSAECRLQQLPWSSLRADTACLRRARYSAACRLQQQLPWSSPRAGTGGPSSQQVLRLLTSSQLEVLAGNPNNNKLCDDGD
jgi:hypothetical protein